MLTNLVAERIYNPQSSLTLGNVPSGAEPWILARAAKRGRPAVFVMSDGQRMADIEQNLGFVAPDLPVLSIPGWDCLPYDRVSPSADVAAMRLSALGRLVSLQDASIPLVVLISINALMQKVPPRSELNQMGFVARPGNQVKMDDLVRRMETNGFSRVPTVREVGEYAVRGGILDAFLPGSEEPIRLDFFGDTLESVRRFDAATQRTTHQVQEFALHPMSEVTLSADTISRFRTRYLSLFGAASPDDALYRAISEGRRFAGMEHWLPLFYESLETAFDYLEGFSLYADRNVIEACRERHAQIDDHFQARQKASHEKGPSEATPYNPVPLQELYLDPSFVADRLSQGNLVSLSPFQEDDTSERASLALPARTVPRWATAVAKSGAETQRTNVFDEVVRFIQDMHAEGTKVIVTAWTEGSLDRLLQVLDEHGLERVRRIESLKETEGLRDGETATALVNLESGFELDGIALIGEQDILGDRLVRRGRRRKKCADFISEVSALEEGDIVVHAEHGIGKFIGLSTIEAAGAPHACLELRYADQAKLFLPVENIELLSRYGSDASEAVLDRLGGVAWQSRKAKLKKRLLEMADELIRIAAERKMRHAPQLAVPDGLYDEFAARFPYEETEDQATTIDAVLDDLGSGAPMDRLICGDVGFGKTEIALRAAFIAAMNGLQVAVVVPTTLLARQHFKTFSDRLRGFPVQIRQASRLVGQRELSKAKKDLSEGKTDIIIGTHALLGKSISFANLGLLIIDEEQHFGVKHKERLKELKSEVHVLTLSATPIPRTLQLAMTGVRELSLITTPPVDRLAIRTFVSPFDPLVIRETLLREHYRGGQSFYVCPRITDLADIGAFLESDVPELKVAVAHGQMPPGELDDIMNAYYEGQYDVLLSTTIVESGLDVPTANTLIVHRSDMFGLAQLYQLRGRVGRSKVRAFSLFTLPVNKMLTATAERRLKVLQSLDTLGAGFELASHDLDIRGAGNLLGEEQSGHIREVGFELYQHMLEEAVAELKGDEEMIDKGWSPQITVGTSVMIPDDYVPDLHLRLGLYRRLGDLTTTAEIDAFGAELIDRFGPLPESVQHLLKIVYMKSLCRAANVEKLDAGPKGVVVQFREGIFPNPEGLVDYLGNQRDLAKIRPDQSILFRRDLPDAPDRLSGAAIIMSKLAEIAEADRSVTA
ncbi:MAG: transcription-repair coupling factor [Pseudomonadota bacterium]